MFKSFVIMRNGILNERSQRSIYSSCLTLSRTEVGNAI